MEFETNVGLLNPLVAAPTFKADCVSSSSSQPDLKIIGEINRRFLGKI